MTIILTGAAGFIGSHVAHALLDRGQDVLGIDDLNPYYAVSLKEARLARLTARKGFRIVRADVSDRTAIGATFAEAGTIEGVIHLAAQAGVRHSLIDPYVYIQSNLMGQVVMLEAARAHAAGRHFVYASSSSVYGANDALPFSVEDRIDRPISLYAATKRADELITYSYAHTLGVVATGLRFFTVYGPWGRPDMAAYLFADAIIAGRPITVFNKGEMWRDFTFVDDIVAGVVAALDRPPVPDALGVRHRVYNLGNNRSERLLDFIALIERELGRSAEIEFAPLQPGDVPATFADIEASRRDLGFVPHTTLAEGIPRFIAWYKSYTGVN
jgi:UDP-glucuronate 4-epimerase